MYLRIEEKYAHMETHTSFYVNKIKSLNETVIWSVDSKENH